MKDGDEFADEDGDDTNDGNDGRYTSTRASHFHFVSNPEEISEGEKNSYFFEHVPGHSLNTK